MDNVQRMLNGRELDRKEARIATAASMATRAAFQRALAVSGAVFVARKGKLVRLSSNGQETVVGDAPARVRKEKTVYRLEWTPQRRD